MVKTASDNPLNSTSDVENLTLNEAASKLRVSRWTIDKLIQAGEIASFTVGSRRLVPAAAIDDYIKKRLAAEAAS